MKRKVKVSDILILLVFFIGAGILSYPTISNYWNEYRNAKLVSEYQTVVSEFSDEETRQIMADARKYNDQHTVNTIIEAFGENNEYELTHPYDELLNPTGNEVMGYLNIPKIHCNLAIYHGVGADVLEKGCGHVEGTSLPIGGESTHSVLAAHRGLPSAKLFTNLDQMEKGDLFFITVLNEKLAYKVDQIKTVLPEETEDLAITKGFDYVTLLTCTPYGVNTHRLLVRGSRVDYESIDESDRPSQSGILQNFKLLSLVLMIIGLGLVLCLILVIIAVQKRKRKRGKRHARKNRK